MGPGISACHLETVKKRANNEVDLRNREKLEPDSIISAFELSLV